MIEPNIRGLSVGRQCALLSISRSSLYYEPKGEPEKKLDLMRVIDKKFLEEPFYGVRQMTWHLRNKGHLVNENRIRRLMRLMGLMVLYQKPNTSNGPVAVWCRSFDSIYCNKGDELWDEHGRTNSARMRCVLR
jgi:putative transposase